MWKGIFFLIKYGGKEGVEVMGNIRGLGYQHRAKATSPKSSQKWLTFYGACVWMDCESLGGKGERTVQKDGV